MSQSKISLRPACNNVAELAPPWSQNCSAVMKFATCKNGFYLTYKLRRVWIIKYSSSAEQPVSTGESRGNVVGGKQKESCALKEEQVLKMYNKWFVTMWWDFLYTWHDWTSRLRPIQSYPTISSLFSSPQKWSYDFPPFSWSSSHIFKCLYSFDNNSYKL